MVEALVAWEALLGNVEVEIVGPDQILVAGLEFGVETLERLVVLVEAYHFAHCIVASFGYNTYCTFLPDKLGCVAYLFEFHDCFSNHDGRDAFAFHYPNHQIDYNFSFLLSFIFGEKAPIQSFLFSSDFFIFFSWQN